MSMLTISSELQEDLDKWLSSPNVAKYREAVRLLQESGILNLLRRIGVPVTFAISPGNEFMAGQAYMSLGYQRCLDNLQYFEKMFSKKNDVDMSTVVADFGGLEAALKKGSLKREDLL